MHIGWRTAPQNLVFAAFAVYSFGLGNIFPRLPDIQHAMGVEEDAFGWNTGSGADGRALNSGPLTELFS